MAKIERLNGAFEVDGATYGPAVCELTEEVDISPRGTTAIRLRGTFRLAEEADLMLSTKPEALLILEDGRQGKVVLTSVTNGRYGTFQVQGDLTKSQEPR
jgi:hypothetical protein